MLLVAWTFFLFVLICVYALCKKAYCEMRDNMEIRQKRRDEEAKRYKGYTKDELEVKLDLAGY